MRRAKLLMRYNQKKLNLSSPGFTIVELLIVVVIIAILAAITIVSYNGITASADDARMATMKKQFDEKLRSGQSIASNPGVLRKNSSGFVPANKQEFMAVHGIESLNTDTCLQVFYSSGGSGQSAGNYIQGSGCFPSLTQGQVPKYDKKKLYIIAQYGFGLIDNVRYSYWSNKDKSWVQKTIETYVSGGEQVIERTSKDVADLACDPFNSGFQAPPTDCRYNPVPQ